MERIVAALFKLLPLIFAFGFLAPVLDQVLVAIGLQPPLGLNTLSFSLIIAGVWGLIACVKGRWI